MALTEKVQEQIAKLLAGVILGLVSFVVLAVWTLPNEWLPTQLIKQLDGYSTGRNLLRLILLVGGLGAWIVYLRPCLVYDKRKGVLKDIKTGIYYCPTCKAEKKIKMPLQEKEVGWYCVPCRWLYNNPDYKPPSAPKTARRDRI